MKTYEDGLNDAWEAARKIGCADGYQCRELENIFGDSSVSHVFGYLTASEAIDAIEKHKSEGIKVGDEVVNKYGWKRVVTNTRTNGDITLMDSSGDFYAYCKRAVEESGLKKTGRHFPQIEEVLKQMQEGNA